MEGFCNLDRDIEGSAKSWKKFVESECPEKEKFPQEWKNKTALQRLCVMRAVRPDRMTYAMRYGTRESGEPQGRHGLTSRAVHKGHVFVVTGAIVPTPKAHKAYGCVFAMYFLNT